MVEGIVRGSIPQVFRPDRDRMQTAMIVMAIAAAILITVSTVLTCIYGPPVTFVATPYYYTSPSFYYPIFF